MFADAAVLDTLRAHPELHWPGVVGLYVVIGSEGVNPWADESVSLDPCDMDWRVVDEAAGVARYRTTSKKPDAEGRRRLLELRAQRLWPNP